MSTPAMYERKLAEIAALEARLAEAVECCTIKDNRNLRLAIRLAEAERLLRDIYFYAEDQGMETLMDMLDMSAAVSPVKRGGPLCTHRHCHIVAQDEGIRRWSCGRIEG